MALRLMHLCQDQLYRYQWLLTQVVSDRTMSQETQRLVLEKVIIMVILSREKTNIVYFAQSIDPDRPKHAAQANPIRQVSSPVDFLFHKSSFYTSIHLRRNVSARISLRRLI